MMGLLAVGLAMLHLVMKDADLEVVEVLLILVITTISMMGGSFQGGESQGLAKKPKCL